MQSNYTITGMTCGHCVAHVTEEVSEVAGVTNVAVQLDGSMAVESEALIPFDAIIEAVREAGDNYVVVEA